MKLSARRILALLLALVLTGVFDVRAETYMEYSGGLSVADVRAANGDTTVYVCINGNWEVAGAVNSTTRKLKFDGGNNKTYYVAKVSDVAAEDVLGPYGFTVAGYSAQDKTLPYTSGTNSWPDATYQSTGWPEAEYIGMGATQATSYKLYYSPAGMSSNSSSASNLAKTNSFYTITINGLPAADAAAVSYGNAYSTEYGKLVFRGNTATITVPSGADYDWTYSDAAGYGSVTRTETAAGTVFTFTNVTAPLTLTAEKSTPDFVTVTLTDEDGNTLETVENVPYGMSVETFLQNNDALALADGSTVHEYKWMLPNNTPVAGRNFQQDTTLTGTKKSVYTVTFLGGNPDGTSEGGSFTNTSAEYTTVQVLEGDSVPAEFITLMQLNIALQENWIFSQWQYSGDEGYLVLSANTPIVRDTVVWAAYTQEAYVRFWTDRNKTEQFTNSGLENQPVGEMYKGNVPSDAAVMAVAPMEGMRFRYWYDLTCGEVFTPDTDKVLHNLDLYPVFERAIFSFVDEDGTVLVAQYEGTPLLYEAEEKDGMYYHGLEVVCSDGSTHVIPNGTEITREYLAAHNIPLPTPDNGRYTIVAEPVWKPLRTVVYHTGDDAQFIIFGAEDDESYTVYAEDEIVLLGALDIVNVDSPIGLALDGWSTTPGGAKLFDANATYSGGDELDQLVAEGGTVHLYPVWAQQENTIAITFHSNYPSGAVDANGNPLTARTYTVYIKSGYKPTMPTLASTGIQNPGNLCADGVTLRYELGGWSRESSGKLTNSSADNTQRYGTYSVGSEYYYTLTQDTTFYAIWIDKEPETNGHEAYFFVTNDGAQPFEPSQYGSGGYLPGGCNTTVGWRGTIKKEVNISNNVDQVEANILTSPDPATILPVLQGNATYVKNFPDIVNMTVDDYGTKWWIEWYGCKFACGKHYHIDGRVRFATQVELNYHPNGGTNPPPSKLYNKETWADVNTTNQPKRDNFIFIGWDEDPSAKVPDYPADGSGLTQIYMDSDKDLYAIWQPEKITIPMDDDFRGQKYEQTNDGEPTRPTSGNRYQFTIEAIELPEGAAPYQKRTVSSDTSGSFTFPRIDVQTEGMYVFEVREVIGTAAVQYDAAVYRLTINIVESDYGLGIAGYSFTRDNKPVVVSGNNVDNVVFEFYNRTDVRNITVSKVWDDGENQDGLRPGSVNVTLRRRGDSIFSQSVTLNAVNGWTWTWENLDIKDNSTGVIYEYYVVEDEVPRYGTSYTGDMNSGLVIINTFPPQQADFRVVKVWQDNNAVSQRPETLTYRLTGTTPDGKVIINSTSGSVAAPYSYVFADMPQYYQGERLRYTLTEEPAPGYDASITSTGDGYGGAIYTVTNTRATTGVTITKQVTGNAADRSAAFAFTVQVLGEDGQPLTNLPAGEGYAVAADGTVTFSLSHGQSVELAQLPLGSTLLLNEENGTYTVTFTPGGTQTADGMTWEVVEDLAITVTNARNAEILTGVTLDTAPYLLLLGLALLGLAGFVKTRKRRAD